MQKSGLVSRLVLNKGCRRVRYVSAAGVTVVSVHAVGDVRDVDS